MKFKITTVAILFAAFILSNSQASYSQNKSILTLAEQYSQALIKFQKQKGRANLEGLLRKGNAVGEKLDEMESLSESNFSRLEKKMKGFVINRDETVFVKPDNVFFGKLATKRGTPADVAFFNLSRRYKPENVWSTFIEQQTDYSGCTIYGKGIFTDLYAQTKRFQRQYSFAYSGEIREMIDDLKSELTENTCVCGDRNGAAKEFRLFISTFPKDKITPLVKKRLKEIENKKTNLRFACHSG
jgi:hypothetical protein